MNRTTCAAMAVFILALFGIILWDQRLRTVEAERTEARVRALAASVDGINAQPPATVRVEKHTIERVSGAADSDGSAHTSNTPGYGGPLSPRAHDAMLQLTDRFEMAYSHEPVDGNWSYEATHAVRDSTEAVTKPGTLVSIDCKTNLCRIEGVFGSVTENNEYWSAMADELDQRLKGHGAVISPYALHEPDGRLHSVLFLFRSPDVEAQLRPGIETPSATTQ